MKRFKFLGLLLSALAFADTPPQIINKTCPTSQWFKAIVPGQVPTCTQPAYSDISGTPTVAWGSITGTLSNQSDLNSALAGKQPLITAGTTAQYWRGDKTFQTLNTAIVPELTNLYWTQGRFDTAFAGKTTSDLAQGSNLYFTQDLARASVSATSPLVYNNTTGVFSTSMSTGNLLGRSTAGTGVFEQITVGSGLSLSSGILSTTSSGTVTAVTADPPLSSSGGATPNITITQSSSSQDGYLSQTDWTTFNNKQSAISFGDLTDVGTDGIIITGGTGSVKGSGVAIAQHVSDATHNGYLKSTDFVAFNAKQPAITTGSISTSTTGVTVGSGSSSTVGPNVTVNIQTASGAQPGLLSDTDWTTFNGKQDAGNYLTALTGDGTASGPGSSALTLATVNSNVGSFTSANLTVDAKGRITAASNGTAVTPGGTSGQVQYNNAGAFGGFGSWNGSTLAITGAISSTTTAAVGTNLHVFGTSIMAGDMVVQGGANFSGNLGFYGASEISQPSGNVLTALSNLGLITSPTLSLSNLPTQANNTVLGNTSGVTAVPSALALGTVTEATSSVLTLTGWADATVGSPTILVKQASGAQSGYLSSTDFSTFNSKQAALSPGSISTSTTGVTVGSGSSSTVGPNVTVNVQTASTSQPGLISTTDWNTFNGKQSALTFSTGLTNTTGTVTVNTSQNIATLSNLTSNGFVKTSGGTGALSVDTSTYLTGNQTVTLSGDVSGSGATAITTTIGSNKVANSQLAQMAANTIKGNNTGSTANAADLTVSQVNTLLGTLSNPMTNAGDQIVGGVSGTPTRVAIGSTSAYWKVVAGTGAWVSPTQMTVQRFTTGSSTYTTPAGCTQIRVKMIGAGGGGGPNGTSGTSAGGKGGDTTFGGNTATGGGGGTASSATVIQPGATAGANSFSVGTLVWDITGTSGGVAAVGGASPTANGQSGYGGGGFFNGGGKPVSGSTNGTSGYAAGGAGGGGGGTSSVFGGPGGAAGGYLEFIITSPSATYSYGVGVGGTAGGGAQNGGAGFRGEIVVEESYF